MRVAELPLRARSGSVTHVGRTATTDDEQAPRDSVIRFRFRAWKREPRTSAVNT